MLGLGLHHNAERRAVSLTALFTAAPTAAGDDDFLDFSHNDLFYQHFRSLIDDDDDDDRALHDVSADSTMTSPLLCDTPYSYLLAEWSCYATSFFPPSNHRP